MYWSISMMYVVMRRVLRAQPYSGKIDCKASAPGLPGLPCGRASAAQTPAPWPVVETVTSSIASRRVGANPKKLVPPDFQRWELLFMPSTEIFRLPARAPN